MNHRKGEPAGSDACPCSGCETVRRVEARDAAREARPTIQDYQVSVRDLAEAFDTLAELPAGSPRFATAFAELRHAVAALEALADAD